MGMVKIGLLILCFMLPLATFARAENVFQVYYMCKNKDGVRTLRLVREAPEKNCTVSNTKLGKDTVVANARQESFCRKHFEDIKSKMIATGWSCRDISPAVVHSEEVKEPEPTP